MQERARSQRTKRSSEVELSEAEEGVYIKSLRSAKSSCQRYDPKNYILWHTYSRGTGNRPPDQQELGSDTTSITKTQWPELLSSHCVRAGCTGRNLQPSGGHTQVFPQPQDSTPARPHLQNSLPSPDIRACSQKHYSRWQEHRRHEPDVQTLGQVCEDPELFRPHKTKWQSPLYGMVPSWVWGSTPLSNIISSVKWVLVLRGI